MRNGFRGRTADVLRRFCEPEPRSCLRRLGRHALGGGLATAVVASGALAIALPAESWRGVARLRFMLPRVAVTGVILAAGNAGAAPAEGHARPGPNVVILGVDSLRLAELQRFGGHGRTPNIDAFLREADIFPDSTTPLARTFPSWMSILTGGHRAALAPCSISFGGKTSTTTPTIADMLATREYTTVYATDEVRSPTSTSRTDSIRSSRHQSGRRTS